MELVDHVEIFAQLLRQLDFDLVGFSVLVEVVDVVGSELTLQRIEDGVDRDIHRFGLRPVDVKIEHRGVGVEGGERIDGFSGLHDPREEIVGCLRDILRRLITGCLQREGHAAGCAESHDGGRHERIDRGIRQHCAALEDIRLNRRDLRFRRRALRPVFEIDNQKTEVFTFARS